MVDPLPGRRLQSDLPRGASPPSAAEPSPSDSHRDHTVWLAGSSPDATHRHSSASLDTADLNATVPRLRKCGVQMCSTLDGWDIWRGKRFRFVRLRALIRPDPHVQPHLAVDPTDAFVVPPVALNVAQIQ